MKQPCNLWHWFCGLYCKVVLTAAIVRMLRKYRQIAGGGERGVTGTDWWEVHKFGCCCVINYTLFVPCIFIYSVFVKSTKWTNYNTAKHVTKHTSYQVPTATCSGSKVPSSGSQFTNSKYFLDLQTPVVGELPDCGTLLPEHVAVGTWYEACFVEF